MMILLCAAYVGDYSLNSIEFDGAYWQRKAAPGMGAVPSGTRFMTRLPGTYVPGFPVAQLRGWHVGGQNL